jgi:hypothetical protein
LMLLSSSPSTPWCPFLILNREVKEKPHSLPQPVAAPTASSSVSCGSHHHLVATYSSTSSNRSRRERRRPQCPLRSSLDDDTRQVDTMHDTKP